MAGKTKRHTDEEIVNAILESHGILSYASKTLECSRQTLYNRIKQSEKLAQAYTDSRETFLDIVEKKLLENVEAGKEASIFFCLRTRGRRRGYGIEPDYSIDFDLEQNMKFIKGQKMIALYRNSMENPEQ